MMVVMTPAPFRRRLLAALSIPCLIFAGLLGYQAYLSLSERGPALPTWQTYLYLAAAVALMALFFAGVRARHAPPDDGSPDH
jgi:hypothetical protein